MAYTVWINVCFPVGDDPVPDMEAFIGDREDLEIEGVNRFATPVIEYPDPEDGSGLVDPYTTIMPDGHGLEILYRAPDPDNGPEQLLALIREIGRAFPTARIGDALRDYSEEDEELELEFTREQLNAELEASRRPTQ
ncbi:hypothetical protein ACLD0W_11090 [Alloalcanivorax sp. C16-1]|uniref:hypothetical protein n=1 Tax=Alloalcanivorax sp. C16-1 TaxID=3390051 RepID=UPI003970AB01